MTRAMIKSMTGFGRCENHQGSRKFTVEMKAVNHRYFDVCIKMPKKLSFFEAAIRNVLKQYVQRGKLDVFITYEDYAEENVALKYNEELAAQYLKYFRQMAEKFGLKDDISVSIYLDRFTLAQITDFIDIATKNKCTNVSALLLQYKHDHYPDYDHIDELILDL